MIDQRTPAIDLSGLTLERYQ